MYYRNRAMRAGALELHVADGTNWEEKFDALIRLHTERWEDCGEQGVFADERVVRWHREALPMLERSGLLRLCSLRLRGEVIGVLYSLLDPVERQERTQYFYLPAFSIQHADLRPGTVLTALAVERAAREGVRTIDMLRGDEEYKRLWHTQRTPTFGFVRYREAMRNRVERAREVAA
jgi:CelD/BcsL family acetyltransferase involved in cellulose biosynthesis